jgi:TIGR03009 family protein
MLKPVATGLAISSLSLSLTVELCAQSGTKKKSQVKQTQAVEGAAPRGGNRSLPSADDDAGEGPQRRETERAKLQRPQGNALRILKLDPETEQVLKDWELHTAKFQKLKGDFYRRRYDPTFAVEKLSTGKFAFEAPDRGNYELQPTEIKKGQVSKKKDKNGQPYALQADTPERWVCTGKEVIRIDEQEKTYEKVTIPPEKQGERIIDGPLPFLFGMKAERAKQRYQEIELLRNEKGEIWLRVVPRFKDDAAHWKEALIIIDSASYVPKAVKLVDPGGGESVHTFTNVEINPFRWIWQADPFKPNLRPYKPALTSKPGAAPATAKDRSSLPDNFDRDGERGADPIASDPPRKKTQTVNRK